MAPEATENALNRAALLRPKEAILYRSRRADQRGNLRCRHFEPCQRQGSVGLWDRAHRQRQHAHIFHDHTGARAQLGDQICRVVIHVLTKPRPACEVQTQL